MKKFLLKTRRQLQTGGILSGIGFVLYLISSVLKAPIVLKIVLLSVFSLISIWTFLSTLLTARTDDGMSTTSFNMGQAAVMLLLVGCLILTLRSLL